MREKAQEYLRRLDRSIEEYMDSPVSERSASAIMAMLECRERVQTCAECEHEPAEFTAADASAWNAHMENEDGTTGGHWSIEQTAAVGQSIGLTFDHVSPWCWHTAMNMMYSDYYEVAAMYKVNTPDFYAQLAKAFLFDKDGPGPKEKLAAYYRGIVMA